MYRLWVAFCLVLALVTGGLDHKSFHVADAGAATLTGEMAITQMKPDSVGLAGSDACCAEAPRSGIPVCAGDTVLAECGLAAPERRPAGRIAVHRESVPGGQDPAGPVQPPDGHS